MEPPSTSPPPLEEVRAALDGELGDEEQFRALTARGKQLIDLALRLPHVIPAGASVIMQGTHISKP